MDQIQIDVFQTPGFVLRLSHGQSVFSAVVIVPQLSGDEDFRSCNKALGNGPFNALAGFVLVLIVVCTVEEAVACLDGLDPFQQCAICVWLFSLTL